MILQVSWFVDIVPRSLSLLLIFLGFMLGVMSMTLSISPDHPVVGAKLSGLIIGVGGVVALYNFYTRYPLVYLASIVVFAKYLEGLASIRFYQKVRHIVRNRDLQYQSSYSFSTRLLVHLLVLFLFTSVGTTAAFLISIDQIPLTFVDLFQLLWIIFTICYTVFGLASKFKLVSRTDDVYNILFLPTLILIVVGTELYNFARVENEVVLFGIGILAYSGGYWYAVYEFLTS